MVASEVNNLPVYSVFVSFVDVRDLSGHVIPGCPIWIASGPCGPSNIRVVHGGRDRSMVLHGM